MAKQDVLVEIFYSAAWHDVTSYVRIRDQIVINHAAGNEQTGVVPSDARFTFDGRDGELNPENRKSSLFGLIGHNTPVRVSYPGDVRFSGQIVSWKPRRALGPLDGTRGDAWVEIEAQGTIRRLGQGEPPKLKSALQRLIVSGNPTAYWALDAGELSTVGLLTSGSGGTFEPLSGSTKFGQGAIAPWLESGVTMSENATMRAPVSGMSAAPTQVTFDYVRRGDGGGSGPSVVNLLGNGSPGNEWIITMTPGSSFDDIEVQLNHNGSFVDSTGPTAVPTLFTNDVHHFRFEAVDLGADIAWAIYIDGTSVMTDTYAATPLTGLGEVRLSYNPGSSPKDLAFGHAVVWEGAPTDISSIYQAFTGYLGETAGNRFFFLCSEEGITPTVVGDVNETQPMGPQHPDTLLALLEEIARTDAGIIHDTRDELGLTFRTGRSLNNQG